MLQALRRFVRERVGVATRDRSREQLAGAVEKNILRLAKRLDRLDKRIVTLTKYVARLDAIAQTGRLRKIEYNVDALVRNAFLDGQLPEPHATLARRFCGLSEHEEDGMRHPLVWARELGRSRIVYDALGHDVRSYESAEHRELLTRALQWLSNVPAPTFDTP